MYQGVFQGSRAAAQPRRILILGESHHGQQISTQHVVGEKYLNDPGDISYRFFDRIARSFGETDRAEFWSKVWFGNYVDEPCGIGDARARVAIDANAAAYNRELFAFVEENRIDLVFCFSRLVYRSLPGLRPENGDRESCEIDHRTHYLMKCVYAPGPRPDLDRTLSRAVTVYGLKHPARGFSPAQYREALQKILAEI